MTDSLRKELDKIRLNDSVEIQLARRVKNFDTSMNHLSVNRILSFNPSQNRNDTLWNVMISFRHIISRSQRSKLDQLLKEYFRSEYITLTLE